MAGAGGCQRVVATRPRARLGETRFRGGSVDVRASAVDRLGHRPSQRVRVATRPGRAGACHAPRRLTAAMARRTWQRIALPGDPPTTTCSGFLPFSTRLGCWDEQAQCGSVPHRRRNRWRRKESNLLIRSRRPCLRPQNRCQEVQSASDTRQATTSTGRPGVSTRCRFGVDATSDQRGANNYGNTARASNTKS